MLILQLQLLATWTFLYNTQDCIQNDNCHDRQGVSVTFASVGSDNSGDDGGYNQQHHNEVIKLFPEAL